MKEIDIALIEATVFCTLNTELRLDIERSELLYSSQSVSSSMSAFLTVSREPIEPFFSSLKTLKIVSD